MTDDEMIDFLRDAGYDAQMSNRLDPYSRACAAYPLTFRSHRREAPVTRVARGSEAYLQALSNLSARLR